MYYADILSNLNSHQLRVASLAVLPQQLEDTSSAMLVVDPDAGPIAMDFTYVCGVILGL